VRDLYRQVNAGSNWRLLGELAFSMLSGCGDVVRRSCRALTRRGAVLDRAVRTVGA